MAKEHDGLVCASGSCENRLSTFESRMPNSWWFTFAIVGSIIVIVRC